MKKVSVVGLGIMGFLAADLLRQRGYAVCGVDPVPAARERAGLAGIDVRESPAQSMRGADAAMLFVPGPDHTEMVVAGPGGLLETASPGSMIMNASTVDPATNQRMAEQAAARGVGFLDTPLLGRPSGVGKWSFLAGGDKADLEKVMDILAVLAGGADKVFHMGAVGNGNKAKLLNNLMFGAINACTAEIMALAEHLGLSRAILFNAAVAAGAGTVSNLYRELVPRILEGRYDKPNFTVDMLKKDNRLALDMAEQAGAGLVLGGAIDRLNQEASQSGLGNDDTSAMWKMVLTKWQTDRCVA